MIWKFIRSSLVLAVMVSCVSAGATDMGAPSKSLLFSPEEAAEVSKAIADYERLETTGQKSEDIVAPPPSVPNIYVTAIADYGDGLWTVWANGYRISPNRQPPGFTVTGVSQDRAEISVPGEQPIRLSLRVAQTWRARSKDIVEGIFP